MPRLNAPAERRIRDRAIVARHRDGASHQVLAEEFGLSKAMVARILQRDLDERERRDLGRQAMRNARLAAVTRQRSGDPSLSLSRAARLVHVRQDELRKRIESGEVRATRIERGRRIDFRIDPDELRADLERFRCRYPGCERYGLGASGCCSPAHAGKVRLAGRPRSSEVVAKITTTKRETYPIAGERFCENPGCGQSLGVKSLARIERGDGHYCSLACSGAGRGAKLRALYRSRLQAEGLVPVREAAGLVARSLPSARQHLPGQRRSVAGQVIVGISAREVLAMSHDRDARRKLAKPLATLNGTGRVGRPEALSQAEVELVLQLRGAGNGWRSIAAAVNQRRAEPVSHMTVKRAFERVSRRPRPAA